jgi:L-glyceraldehyde 3-phosphate reductase
LNEANITQEKVAKVTQLNNLALQRGQSLAQMAIAWVLNNKAVTSAIVGASKVSQIEDCVAALNNLEFSEQELTHIDSILGQ